jgi:mutator protein MutT
MEYWDLYDINRKPLNIIHKRGDPIQQGAYHIVVFVIIKNSQNKIILTKRDPRKEWPNKWEYTGGSVVAGEDSITGALREVDEEIGIKLNPENGKLIDTIIRGDSIRDLYLFCEDVNIAEAKLQPGEVTDIKWVDEKELMQMIKNDELDDLLVEDYQQIKDKGLI